MRSAAADGVAGSVVGGIAVISDPSDRTYIRRGTARPAARFSQTQEQSDAGGRHRGRPEGAHSAQDATATGRVISTIGARVSWRILAASTQLVYVKTLLKRRLESAMNSILAHCKNVVCDKSC